MTLNGQLTSFILTVGIGLLAGFVYDIYRVSRQLMRLRKTGLFFGDLFYWLVITALVFVLLMFGNQGEMRFYVLLGLALGAFIHFKFLSPGARRIILLLWQAVCRTWLFLWRLFALFWRGLVFPFKILFLVFALPCHWLSIAFGAAGRGAARMGKRFLPSRGRLWEKLTRPFARLKRPPK